MSDVALRMDHVFKKFKKGEIYDSLRDLIPALTGRMLRAHRKDRLQEKEFWALSDISFQVERGTAFGIIGPNGAGKSTILKLLTGIMKPTKGTMVVNGRLSALIEVGAGFHPDLTGRENIFLNGTILGMKRQEIRAKFDEIVEFADLAEFIDTPVKRYSSGMYARLGFSVAAHVDPQILIVDEVLSVGDYLFQRQCFNKMSSVIRSGASVVFVSHNLRAVAELCQSSLFLDRGRSVKIGNTSEVVQHYMELGISSNRRTTDNDAFVSRVEIYDKNGETVQFQTGQTIWCEIDVTARVLCAKLSVTISLVDDKQYHIFDTSTQRLGCGTVTLREGEIFSCKFQLDLHIASGVYRLGVQAYRYDVQHMYDLHFPAATIFIHSNEDVRGVVNLYPKVVAQEIRRSAKAQ